MGIVKKNSILLVDFTNERRKRGLGLREALLEACPIRLRPILMTSVATIAGAVPDRPRARRGLRAHGAHGRHRHRRRVPLDAPDALRRPLLLRTHEPLRKPRARRRTQGSPPSNSANSPPKRSPTNLPSSPAVQPYTSSPTVTGGGPMNITLSPTWERAVAFGDLGEGASRWPDMSPAPEVGAPSGAPQVLDAPSAGRSTPSHTRLGA